MQAALIIGGGLAGIYGAFKTLQPWFNNWGSSRFEREMEFPGETKLSDPKVTSTHAITINGTPSEIWPWLVQLGANKGGFYSYAWLENLVGCGVKNADRIIPEFQDLKEGDEVILHPKAPPLKVTYLEKNRSLALEGWMFYLRPIDHTRTRLIARTYAFDQKKDDKTGKIANFMFRSVFFDFAHFIMEQKQLREIKRMVERNGQLKDFEMVRA